MNRSENLFDKIEIYRIACSCKEAQKSRGNQRLRSDSEEYKDDGGPRIEAILPSKLGFAKGRGRGKVQESLFHQGQDSNQLFWARKRL